MIGELQWVGKVEWIGEGGSGPDPFFYVTHLGEVVTNNGIPVTHTIPIPEFAVYYDGEPVTHLGEIVTNGA